MTVMHKIHQKHCLPEKLNHFCETRTTNTKASHAKQKSRNAKHRKVNNYFSLMATKDLTL